MSKILIGAVVGAVIGYITNYIAIKMLFRPYTEKRILGIKIPFTPGLIPKEKTRIAKSIGESISSHLINYDTIKNSLEDDKIKLYIKSMIKEKVEAFKNNDKIIGSFMKFFGIHNLNNWILNKLSPKILNYFYDEISDTKIEKEITPLIKKIINEKLSKEPNLLIELLNKEEFKEKTRKFLNESLNSDHSKRKLNSIVHKSFNDLENSTKKIKDIIPKEFVSSIELYVYNERDNISNTLSQVLLREEVEEKIKEAIRNNVLNNLSPLIAMFLSEDTLYSKFINIAQGYLKEEENKLLLVKIINEGIEQTFHKEIAEVLKEIPKYSREKILDTISNFILTQISNNLAERDVVEFFIKEINKFSSYKDIINVLWNGYDTEIDYIISNGLKNIKNKKDIKELLKNKINNFVFKVMDIKIKDLICNREENIISIIYSIAEKLYDNFINKELYNTINILNIPKLVEDQINSFEVDYTEKIILEIAQKELKSITWLGALLGGILGVLSPILSNLY